MARIIGKPLLCGLVALGFIGGFLILGALAALTHSSPVGNTPYRFGWYLWSYEVFTLIVTAISVAVDFRKLRLLVATLLAVQTALYSDRIELFLTKAADLPGSNGSATRGHIVGAGLIIVVIANSLIIIAAGLSPLEDEAREDEGKPGSRTPLHIGATVEHKSDV